MNIFNLALLRYHLPQKQSANSQNDFSLQQSTSSSTQIGHSRQRTTPQLPIQAALQQIVSQSFKQQQMVQQPPQSQQQFIVLSGSSQNSSSPASITAADSPSMNQAQGMEQPIAETPNNNGQKQQNDELAICQLCNNRIM